MGIKESVVFRIYYVDTCSEPYGQENKNHYLTYVEEDIKVVDNINSDVAKNSRSIAYQYRMDMPHIKLRGDISELREKTRSRCSVAKDYDFGHCLLLVILIIIEAIIATKIAKNDFREKAEDTEIVANGKNNNLLVA